MKRTKHSTNYFFRGAPAFFKFTCRLIEMVFTQKTPQKGEYCYCVCIYFKMEKFPINSLNYICTSTTIYQRYFGESPSTYKNNTDWTGVV